MKVMAQIAMVMNLDKCIGCHTCSVTCKQVWTNREGTEYIWFNNVETRPGVGYPRGWEDQKKWKGGWKRTATGRLVPRQGGRVASLAKIFANPTQPTMKDYYEPWTYEYDKLLQAPANSRAIPTARAKSKITGEHIDKPEWGPNWDDDLGGSMETLDQDPVLHQMNLQVAKTIEDAYMFYLPRICEHCLNPTCVSACPSGAMYKRSEDGMVEGSVPSKPTRLPCFTAKSIIGRSMFRMGVLIIGRANCAAWLNVEQPNIIKSTPASSKK